MAIEVWVQHNTKTVLITDAGTPPLDCAGDHWEFTEWWGAEAIADTEAKKLGYRVVTHSVHDGEWEYEDEYDDDGF